MILKMFKNFFTFFCLKWETFYYYLTLKHRKSVTKERLTETYYFFSAHWTFREHPWKQSNCYYKTLRFAVSYPTDHKTVKSGIFTSLYHEFFLLQANIVPWVFQIKHQPSAQMYFSKAIIWNQPFGLLIIHF